MGKGKQKLVRLFCPAFIIAVLSWLLASPLPFNPSPEGFRSRAANSDTAAVSTSTREGRLAVFDDAWATINQRYYDRSFHGLDWDAQRISFRVLAAETNSSQQLYAVLRRMIASLNDPHTRVFAPEEKFDWWRPRFVTIGVAIREIGGQPTVVQVDSGSAPQRAGLRAGDLIEGVNGEQALDLINKRLNGPVLPTASLRMRSFATLLDGPAETTVEIRWRGKNGKQRFGRFRRYWQQRDLGLRLKREKGDLAVIEIDAFTKPIASSFARALTERLDGTRGIILDLRHNGGGDAEAMADIASFFLGSGFGLGQFTDRSGGGFSISTRSQSAFMVQRIEPTKLPLVVLTSERTSSASEIFIAALKSSGRARIIGAETCGCVLAIRTRHLLPDGGLLDVSELDYQTSAGERLEKHGIKPDEIVVVERSDLYSNRDRAMESAVMRLARPQAHLN